MEFPIRLNKYLAEKGYASRRKADEYIERGLVKINGKKATLGDKVNEEDTVEVGGEVEKDKESYAYYVFNKPWGVVSTNPQGEEEEVLDLFNTPEKVAVIGRLDKESEGLLLLTNDGRVTHRLLSPEFAHEKEYRVKVHKPLKERVVRIFERGMNIEGEEVKGAKAEIVGDKTLLVTLTEGKRHQIRRMLSALGYETEELKRVRIMNIKIGNLKVGEGRPLTSSERKDLLTSLGL